MAKLVQNKGIRIVADFICEVQPESSVSREQPTSRGRSEGVHVLAEFVVDLKQSEPNDNTKDVSRQTGEQ